MPVVEFADLGANERKVARIRAFGARVVPVGEDFDAARAASEAHAAEVAGRLRVDGREPWIATGAATLAVELTDAIERGALPRPGTVFVPVGNGALIVGVGAWLRHALPDCRVVGVQSDAAPSMTRSWRAGRPIETPSAAAAWAAILAARPLAAPVVLIATGSNVPAAR